MQYRKFETPSLLLGITILSYKLMVTAFSLMNKPSDTALYMGAALLVFTAIGFPTSIALLWRRR